MTRFLIEVPHEPTKEACERAVRIFLQTGSHFITNADWGCKDDEHKAWIIVELDSKKQAREMLPSLFRERAKIVALQQFDRENIVESVEMHED
jgi:hypothetical protein